MPLSITPRYDTVSLAELVRLQARGYALLKTPHVGNQHPSNLVCAALGFPLEMVSFTQGVKDRNFHPHVKIVGGLKEQLYDQRMWTPFANVPDGRSAIEYHQSSLTRLFPRTFVSTEMELLRSYPALAAVVLRATNQAMRGLWYRQVDEHGRVYKRSMSQLSEVELETNVFGFSNDRSGWVLPNRVALIFDFVYQALSSGRSVIYPLSGPQMSSYIGGMQGELERMYDVVRQYIPELPIVLEVRMVPLAAARFVTHRSKGSELKAVCELLTSFGNEIHHTAWYRELVSALPELVAPIESGTFLSQYDLQSSGDLYIDPWLLETPLSVVGKHYEQLVLSQRSLAAE